MTFLFYLSGLLEASALLYFFYVVGYTVVSRIGALLYDITYSTPPPSPIKERFLVLIPAYKEDAVIGSVARAALSQSYQKELFTVVVVADSLQPSTLEDLKRIPVQVVEVSFDVSTKVRALNRALAQFTDTFRYVVILDADNVMEPDFIQLTADRLAASGNKAIQGQRVPKNSNNSLAILDGLSEAINNMIYRQGSVGLRCSASISGSGVVFDYGLLKQLLAEMDSIGGFDRELEIRLLESGFKVGYEKNARVYDEKVSQLKSFENQRRRWISSQYHYLRKYFGKGCVALIKGDISLFNSAVLRNIQLPRLLNIGLLFICTIASLLLEPWLIFGSAVWILLFLVNSLTLLLCIPKSLFNKNLLRAILALPGIFWKMLQLMLRLKGANKKFIHTPHSVSNVE